MKRPETAQETFLYQHQQYKRKIHFLRIFIFVVFSFSGNWQQICPGSMTLFSVPRNGLSPALCKC